MIDQFASIPSCEICSISYDLENRIPRMLPCCGKTLCRKCLERLSYNFSSVRCPWCKRVHQPQTEFKTNFQLLGVIEENLKWEICAEHGEAMKLFCLQDRCKVCAYCHSLGTKANCKCPGGDCKGISPDCLTMICKGHNLVSLASIKPEADKGRKKFENNLELLEKKYQDSNTKLNKNRETMEEMICKYFEEQEQALQTSKIKALHNFNIECEKERAKFDENFGEESSLRNELKSIISNHMNFLRSPDPKEIIDRDYASLQNRVNYFTSSNSNGLSFEQQLSQIVPKMRNNMLEQSSTMVKGWETFIGSVQKEITTEIPLEFHNPQEESHSKKDLLKFNSGLKVTFQDSQLILEESSEEIETELSRSYLKEIHIVVFKFKALELKNQDWDRVCQLFDEVGTQKPLTFLFASNSRNFSINKISRLFSILCRKSEVIVGLGISVELNNEILQLLSFILPQFSIISSVFLKIEDADISLKYFNQFIEKLHSITPRLESLDLSFSKTKLPLSIFKGIFVKMPVLNYLNLDVSEIPNLNAEIISPLLDDSKNLMPKLEKLVLNVSQTKIRVSDSAVLKDRFRHIKSFELKLKDPESERAQNQVNQSQISPPQARQAGLFSSTNFQNQPVNRMVGGVQSQNQTYGQIVPPQYVAQRPPHFQ